MCLLGSSSSLPSGGYRFEVAQLDGLCCWNMSVPREEKMKCMAKATERWTLRPESRAFKEELSPKQIEYCTPHGIGSTTSLREHWKSDYKIEEI